MLWRTERGSRRPSDSTLTRSEIKKALRSATGKLLSDMAQEKPLMPPEGSPMTIRASPQGVQANSLVAGLTHTLGGVRR